MVRGQDPIRYHLRRQVRQSVMGKPAPHTRFLTLPRSTAARVTVVSTRSALAFERVWEETGCRSVRLAQPPLAPGRLEHLIPRYVDLLARRPPNRPADVSKAARERQRRSGPGLQRVYTIVVYNRSGSQLGE